MKMSRTKTTNEFIQDAINVHGNKYDYSKVEYINNKTKVCIICPIHGEFWQRPNDHLSGYSCAKCANNINYTTEQWVNIAKAKFPNIDYSRVNYINARTPVLLTCPKHGELWVTPSGFMGNVLGCPKCGNITSYTSRRLSYDDFISRSHQIHGDKYNYSRVPNLPRANKKVTIICPEHGEFQQTPYSHMKGYGCPKCAIVTAHKKQIKTTKQFIQEAQQVHGKRYDYSKVVYTGKDKKVIIICKQHGEFEQTPHSHVSGKSGCPKCNQSHGERMIENYLIDHNIQYESQKVCYLDKNARKTNKIVLDFVVKYNNRYYIIEYNGQQHYNYIEHMHKSYERFELQKNRDEILRKKCRNKGYILLEIPYTMKEDQVIQLLDSVFSTKGSIIYTDGAYSSSTDLGGWSFIETINNEEVYSLSSYKLGTTNNRMELTALLFALRHCITQNIKVCTIYTDSQYVQGCAVKNWSRNKNVDLWAIYDKLMNIINTRGYNINLLWIKGHSNEYSIHSKFNNRADKLAVEASQWYNEKK